MKGKNVFAEPPRNVVRDANRPASQANPPVITPQAPNVNGATPGSQLKIATANVRCDVHDLSARFVIVNPQSPLQRIHASGKFDNNEDNGILHHLVDRINDTIPAPTSIDVIGGCTGNDALYLALALPDLDVRVFEPNALIYSSLALNVALNRRRNVSLFPYGIASEPGGRNISGHPTDERSTRLVRGGQNVPVFDLPFPSDVVLVTVPLDEDDVVRAIANGYSTPYIVVVETVDPASIDSILGDDYVRDPQTFNHHPTFIWTRT